MQSFVRLRTSLGNADEALFEERADDAKLVIEELIRFVYFMTLVEEQQCKVIQDTTLKTTRGSREKFKSETSIGFYCRNVPPYPRDKFLHLRQKIA